MALNLDLIYEATEQRRYSRQVNILADALIYALNIGHGVALVPFLAPTKARDNREAVAIWVSRELKQPDIELSRHCIEILLPRLEKMLQSIEEATW